MTGITMDGTHYDVRIPYNSLTRSFTLIEGANAGTSLSYRAIRDLGGTGYTYKMDIEPNPANYADYDAFYQAISAPVDYHTITVPYNQSTMTFQAKVKSGTDKYRGKMSNYEHWSGLSVTFEYIEPQREAD